MNCEKILIEERRVLSSGGIRADYPIDRAAWLWLPDIGREERAFAVFENSFTVEPGREEVVIHLSGDQRYEFFCDGEFVCAGPDKCHTFAWSFASYRLRLAPGKHTLTANVWWLGEQAPLTLCTVRGGFALLAEGAYDAALTTGKGDWRVARRMGAELAPANDLRQYHVVGGKQTIDGALFLLEPREWQEPEVVQRPLTDDNYGGVWQERVCAPSRLPDQFRREVVAGRFVALTEGCPGEEYAYTAADCAAGELARWNALLREGEAVRVEPGRSFTLILDLENYYCAYAQLAVNGGRGARVDWEWAESLFVPAETLREKGNRNEVAGKVFRGFGHTFICSGAQGQEYRPYWWNAGRYCRIRINTGSEALTIGRVSLLETRYPLENGLEFAAAFPGMERIVPLCVRVMQMCAHEAYMDCPYYEQLMYVGDARLEMLTTYAMTADSRLPARAVELFRESIRDFGAPGSRTPTRQRQLIPTFSLIWIWMVNDYYFWRGDRNWLAEFLPDVRAVLGRFARFEQESGLIQGLPGWSFVDWVPQWSSGYPPAALEGGLSSIINLHYLLALLKAAELEEAGGEPALAGSMRAKAARLAGRIRETFYCAESGLLADDTSFKHFSEHAQCLALIGGLFADEPDTERRMLEALLERPDLARCTIYFSFYFFEVCTKYGLTDRLLARMGFWAELADNGLKTTIEQVEPARSDCHAWGAYPLYFFVRCILGLEPLEAGMHRVRIKPQLGSLPQISGSVPHPLGRISFALHSEDGVVCGKVTLPRGISAEISTGMRITLNEC